MGGGWVTELGLVNTSGTTASGRIDIFDADGRALAVKLNGDNGTRLQPLETEAASCERR